MCFVPLQPEFDEWVAMDDISSLPEKCRCRPVLDVADEEGDGAEQRSPPYESDS